MEKDRNLEKGKGQESGEGQRMTGIWRQAEKGRILEQS